MAKKASIKDPLKGKRHFVIDTNVLLHDSNSLFSFKGGVLVIPFVVLEELDEFKKDNGERGSNARQVIRTLDELRSRGALNAGVELNHDTGSILKVMTAPEDLIVKVGMVYNDIKDNIIILTVQSLLQQGIDAVLVTKDINARVKSDSLGLQSEDYTAGTIVKDDFNKGWFSKAMPSGKLKMFGAQKVSSLSDLGPMHPNEFVVAHSENNPENCKIFRFLGGKNFKEVKTPKLKWNLGAKNLQQMMALDLLMDDSVKMVSLIGPAGTGKTFLTLLAGLQKVASERVYRKLLVTRPLVALGNDVGYLPGDLDEKLHHWMKPIHDNLEFIYSTYHKEDDNPDEKKRRKRSVNGKTHKESEVEMLIQRGIVNMEAITYMRGRSIPKQFIFIDEVQNLTPHEVKTIVSRAGEGSKIVLAGDPHQIDSPYLNFESNGLTVTSEKFRGQPIFGSVYLETSERSKLAELSSQLL